MKGQTIAHYRIGPQLGSGGMGVVYSAEDIRLGRAVAVKFLAPELVNDDTALARFAREARSASALNHPHICTIYDVGESGPHRYIVMELLEGHTLNAVVQHRPLDSDLLLQLSIQVSDALQAAHDRGIVHRDIKPANIFVTRDGNAKILDFGLAKLTHETGAASAADVDRTTGKRGHRLTSAGVRLGTVAYMSPEQVRGAALDHRSDLFSLGAVIYEMATGDPAFTGSTDANVFDAILYREPVPATAKNQRLPRLFDDVIARALEKDRDLRYQTAADLKADLQRMRRDSAPRAPVAVSARPAATPPRRRVLAALWAVPALVLLALLMAWRGAPAATLAERDRILVGDFINETGEAVFDETIERAVAFQLEQSPYFDLVPEPQVAEVLRFMARPPDEPITVEIAREICERGAVAAWLSGSIARLGSTYAIHLDARGCSSGETLASEQIQAEGREKVLPAVGAAITRMRATLGETLASVERFNQPIEQATTASLPALRAYSIGHRLVLSGRQHDAIPLFKEATTLDPDFALAYARLSTIYGNLGMENESVIAAREAFAGANHVSERERLYITQRYHSVVTGDAERYRAVLELYAQTFPGDAIPHINLGDLMLNLGQFEQALVHLETARRLNPRHRTVYDNLAIAHRALGRYGEADAIMREQIAHTQETGYTHIQLFETALAAGATDRMEEERRWFRQRGDEIRLLVVEANECEFTGRFRRLRELVELGTQRDTSRNDAVGAAWRLSDQAAREAVVGHAAHARRLVERALAMASTPEIWARAALPAALAADARLAGTLLEKVHPQFASNTEFGIYFARNRAAMALAQHDPAAAIDALAGMSNSELGLWAGYWVVYLRGVAYQQAGNAAASLNEFDKILRRRGLEPYNVLVPLSHLQAARAAAATGDITRSRAEYDRFLSLWATADEDLPVVREARREFAALPQ